LTIFFRSFLVFGLACQLRPGVRVILAQALSDRSSLSFFQPQLLLLGSFPGFSGCLIRYPCFPRGLFQRWTIVVPKVRLTPRPLAPFRRSFFPRDEVVRVEVENLLFLPRLSFPGDNALDVDFVTFHAPSIALPRNFFYRASSHYPFFTIVV